jgi:hypothetical protein
MVGVAEFSNGYQVSTADSVQALLFTLINDLRGLPLVPSTPQMFTTTAGGTTIMAYALLHHTHDTSFVMPFQTFFTHWN